MRCVASKLHWTCPSTKPHVPSWDIFTDISSDLTLKLFKPPLQLVVVEGSLARESRAGAGPPDRAEAGARTPAGAGVRWAGAARRWGQGAGIVQGRGERAGETAGGALKLHDETPERTKDLDQSSPQRHRGDTQQRNIRVSKWMKQFPVESKRLQEKKVWASLQQCTAQVSTGLNLNLSFKRINFQQLHGVKLELSFQKEKLESKRGKNKFPDE